jgi:hypothetical protein
MKGPLFTTFRYRRHIIQICSDLKPSNSLGAKAAPARWAHVIAP